MARTFREASSQYLTSSTPPTVSTSFTLSCWARAYTFGITAAKPFMAISTNGSNDNRIYLGNINDTNPGAVAFGFRQTSSQSVNNINTGNYMSANVWYHVCGIARSSTDLSVFLNGTRYNATVTAQTPSGMDRFTVGTLIYSSQIYCDADVAEAAVWDTDLSDGEVASLAKGLSPLLVRPGSLQRYVPCRGTTTTSDEIELLTGNGLTQTNSPGVVDHPRVFYPRRRQFRYGVTAAGGSLSTNVLPGGLTYLGGGGGSRANLPSGLGYMG